MSSIDFTSFLKLMAHQKASDLFITAGMPPSMKVHGKISPITQNPLTPQQSRDLVLNVMTPSQREEFEKTHECNFAIGVSGVGRFRVSCFYQRNQVGMVLRRIETRIPTVEELSLPPIIKTLAMTKRGIIIFVGATGSGKSTSLAAMVDFRNENSHGHIITLEDPVEFVHPHKKSTIVHREVGDHTRSFGDALKGAMRHDPDIVLLGEMRELETIKLALGCASMGMLVFGTLHTNNAPKTVDRIINTFPAEEQNQVRVMLAGCLAGVVAQLLCKRIPKGRCAVHEILLQHEALPNTIRSGQIANIRSIIESGKEEGMVTMDNSLMARVKDGTIEAKEAYMKGSNKALFAPLLKPGDLEAGH